MITVRYLLCGLVICGLSGHAHQVAQLRQPRYQGRTLTEWLMDFDSWSGNSNAPVVTAIRHIGTNALPVLLKIMRPEDSRFYPNDPAELRQERAAAAFEALGSNAKPVVPELLVLLNNKDATAHAACALRAIDWSAEVAREAAQSLTNENDRVRSSIDQLIRSAGANASAAVPILIGFIRDRNSLCRGHAANVIADLHLEPAVAVPALIDLLQDNDASLRACAARALGRFGKDSKVAVPALLSCLGDSNILVCADAMSALRGIDPDTAAPALPEFLKRFKTMPTNVRLNLTPDLLEFSDDPGAMSVLIENLRDKDRRLRYWITFLLAGIGKSAQPSVPELSERLNDSEKWVRVFAAIALREIGEDPAKAVAALVAVLQDDDPYLRRAAAEHLGGFGAKAKSAVPALLSAWASVDSEDRFAVADALRQIDPEAAKKAGVK